MPVIDGVSPSPKGEAGADSASSKSATDKKLYKLY